MQLNGTDSNLFLTSIINSERSLTIIGTDMLRLFFRFYKSLNYDDFDGVKYRKFSTDQNQLIPLEGLSTDYEEVDLV